MATESEKAAEFAWIDAYWAKHGKSFGSASALMDAIQFGKTLGDKATGAFFTIIDPITGIAQQPLGYSIAHDRVKIAELAFQNMTHQDRYKAAATDPFTMLTELTRKFGEASNFAQGRMSGNKGFDFGMGMPFSRYGRRGGAPPMGGGEDSGGEEEFAG
jgi:hypothetical protein